MATATLKRKRVDVLRGPTLKKKVAISTATSQKKAPQTSPEPGLNSGLQTQGEPLFHATNPKLVDAPPQEDVCLQIVAGSYDRILHGISATISRPGLTPVEDKETTIENGTTTPRNVAFSDTFLFAAHSSSIRCLALSPQPDSGSNKRILATGGSDERINLYTLSTAPRNKASNNASLSTLTIRDTAEDPRNKSLGNLIHHDRPITRLHFPSKSKLFSAAEDNTVAISRTRDWTVLSSIKAPIPKPQGRPSGDTAGPGEVPAGVNDFAIHPSQKLMLSVSRGERCMRLWNLMTGKKAGVLNFDRELLAQVGEGKYGSGEGRKVLWNEDGEVFVVGFERGAVVYGVDSKPKALIKPTPGTKVHQMRFLPRESITLGREILALSTEDGRVMFFDVHTPEEQDGAEKLPLCGCLAQLGGLSAGITSRVKDFEILQIPRSPESDEQLPLVITTGSSDGAVRVWTISTTDLVALPVGGVEEAGHAESTATKQIGNLVGEVETGNRITCLAAFLLDGRASLTDKNGAEEGEAGPEDFDSEDDMSD